VCQSIRFRDCVHRDIAGPTAEAVIAAVRGDYCAQAAAPVDSSILFHGVTQLLGESELRAIWSAFLKEESGHKANPLEFPDYLARHEHGRALPALADLARFDLAHYLAAQPSQMPSIASCCLPKMVLRRHPGTILRFQSGWRYLVLAWPVHRLLAEPLSAALLRRFTTPAPVGVRIAPAGMGVGIQELAPADFALQAGLRSGQRLADAALSARALDPEIDPFSIVAGLVEAGAIMDAMLHPAETPTPTEPHRNIT
jgi:hypothetical protein